MRPGALISWLRGHVAARSASGRGGAPDRRSRRVAIGWALVCLVMAGWVVAELLWDYRPPSPSTAAVRQTRVPQVAEPPAPGFSTIGVLRSRVLFRSKNPAASDVRVKPAVDELARALRLRSTMKSGDEWVAYIAVKDEGLKRVAKGDHIGEFAVLVVRDRYVELGLASERVRLRF